MGDFDELFDLSIDITFSGEKGDRGERGFAGEKGDSIKGDKGEKGDAGLSLKGDKGDSIKGEKGDSGLDGKNGKNGKDGIDGVDGLSAYEIWLQDNEGTEEKFIKSLKGKDGKDASQWAGNAYTELKEQEDVRITTPLNSQALVYDSATKKWNNNNINLSTGITGVLSEIHGGTNQSTYTLGDTLYSSATNTLAKLNGNITTIKKFYTQTGTGTISDTPAWSTVSDTDVNFTNNSTGNASTAAHGYLPILPGNTTTFLRADGAFVAPSTSAIPSGTFQQGFAAVTSVVVTHNLGSYPHVQLIDGSLAVFIPLTITNNSINQLTITFSASTTGTVLLTSGAPLTGGTVTTAVNYQITTSDESIFVTADAKTTTLPTAIGNTALGYTVFSPLAGYATIDTLLGQTINGVASIVISNGSSATFKGDGANWRIK